ncbi:hypothetical protein EV363DRAFT_1178126, partial [Boletus edulis]
TRPASVNESWTSLPTLHIWVRAFLFHLYLFSSKALGCWRNSSPFHHQFSRRAWHHNMHFFRVLLDLSSLKAV